MFFPLGVQYGMFSFLLAILSAALHSRMAIISGGLFCSVDISGLGNNQHWFPREDFIGEEREISS